MWKVSWEEEQSAGGGTDPGERVARVWREERA